MLKATPTGFEWDELEPPFTEAEMSRARHVRRVNPLPSVFQKRPDHCPHQQRCANIHECLESIAWYLRYQSDIEAHLTAIGKQP